MTWIKTVSGDLANLSRFDRIEVHVPPNGAAVYVEAYRDNPGDVNSHVTLWQGHDLEKAKNFISRLFGKLPGGVEV